MLRISKNQIGEDADDHFNQASPVLIQCNPIGSLRVTLNGSKWLGPYKHRRPEERQPMKIKGIQTMWRLSMAPLLLTFIRVQVAGQLGSIHVFEREVHWTFGGTVYEISSTRRTVDGDTLLVPKTIRFRMPSPLPLRAKLRLLAQKNHRVKKMALNDSTFKIRYNKTGNKVVRLTCRSGTFCSRKRKLGAAETTVNEVVEGTVEDVPVHRNTQEELAWSCDSCQSFFSSMCNERGISLLCDEDGMAAVEKTGEIFVIRTVKFLCDTITNVCQAFDLGDDEETCFFSLGADNCNVEASDERTSAPSLTPTSAPTGLVDQTTVEDLLDFGLQFGNRTFGQDDGLDAPVFTASDDNITEGESFVIVDKNGNQGEIVVNNIKPIDPDEADLPDDVEPIGEDLDQLLEQTSVQSQAVDASLKENEEEEETRFLGLLIEIDVTFILNSQIAGIQLFLVVVGDASLFIVNRDALQRRRLEQEAENIVSPIRMQSLQLERKLQDSEICIGAGERLPNNQCAERSRARLVNSCVDRAVETSGAAGRIDAAQAAHNARLDAGLLLLQECLDRGLDSWAQFANFFARSCVATDMIPTVTENSDFNVAEAAFASCYAKSNTRITEFGVRQADACYKAYNVEVELPSLEILRLDTEAACREAQEFVAANCFACIDAPFSGGGGEYAQLSSGRTQPNNRLPTSGKLQRNLVGVTFDSLDAVSEGFADFEAGTAALTIPKTGYYFVLAAPQTGICPEGIKGPKGKLAGVSKKAFVSDYYVQITNDDGDWEDAANSNVRYTGLKGDQDVIITQGVYFLLAGQEFRIVGTGIASCSEFIEPPNEPAIPSIIFSIFLLPHDKAIAQLSSDTTQIHGPIGEGVPIIFPDVDAIESIEFDEDAPSVVTIPKDGTYFVVAAPQVGYCGDGDDDTFIADVWVVIDGENAANSNVRMTRSKGDQDVIISQGVYAGLESGQKLQIYGSGENSCSEVIEPVNEPRVPAIMFSIFEL